MNIHLVLERLLAAMPVGTGCPFPLFSIQWNDQSSLGKAMLKRTGYLIPSHLTYHEKWNESPATKVAYCTQPVYSPFLCFLLHAPSCPHGLCLPSCIAATTATVIIYALFPRAMSYSYTFVWVKNLYCSTKISIYMRADFRCIYAPNWMFSWIGFSRGLQDPQTCLMIECFHILVCSLHYLLPLFVTVIVPSFDAHIVYFLHKRRLHKRLLGRN